MRDASLHGFLLIAPVFIISLTLHELAHALTAYSLGDRSSQEMGRLTLNPLAHLDPLGSLVLVITYFSGTSFLFGWAKPVMVDPNNLRTSPQVGMALVGAAGPATNFVLATLAAAVWAHTEITGDALEIVYWSIIVNVSLGIFNLLPIPPLDGSRIVGGFMPRAAYAQWTALDQYGMYAVFALVIFFQGPTSSLLGGAFDAVLRIISAIVGGYPLI